MYQIRSVDGRVGPLLHFIFGELIMSTRDSEVKLCPERDNVMRINKDNKPYGVLHWGSHPDNNNDDCYTGQGFDSASDALAAFKADPEDSSVAFIEIDGLTEEELVMYGIGRVRKNPNFKPSHSNDDDWKREQAMQAGMEFGIDAYNEMMGYD